MDLILSFEIENNVYNIKSIDNINITIHDCNENQISIPYNDDGFYYCEDTICYDECTSERAICKAKFRGVSYKNKPENNKCECKNGYAGERCEILLFENLSSIKFFSHITSLIINIIIIITAVIIIMNRKKLIVKDPGFFKHLLILLGLFFYFLSSFFISKENWTQSCHYFLFKHSGIILIYFIFNLYTNSEEEFGIENKEEEIKKSIKNSYTNGKTLKISSYDVKTINKERKISAVDQIDMNFISELKIHRRFESIRRNHNLYKAYLVVYPLAIIVIIFFIFYYGKIKYYNDRSNNGGINVQGQNGMWYFESSLESIDNIFNILEFIIFIILTGKLNLVSKYQCIFYNVKLIYMATIIVISLGPIINILSKYTLKNLLPKLYFNYVINTLCYCSLYVIYFKNMLYYLLFKKEMCDEIKVYFIFPSMEFCYEHWSYICSCNQIISLQEINSKMKEYISLYTRCSRLFYISSGYMKFIESTNNLNGPDIL